MRNAGFTLPAAATLALALALSACGGTEAEPPEAAEQRGIERSIADIRAAEAAMQEPVVVSRSVGELTGKASAEPKARASTAAAARAGAAEGAADAAPAEG